MTGVGGGGGHRQLGAGIEHRTTVLIGQGIQPIGLGARDTLRLEMGYLLSGQDFKRDRTTMETNCSWVIKWDHDFMGREVMEGQKATKNKRDFGVC